MVTNISAYRFAPLDGLKSLRAALMEACQQGGLKGTILLSTEGINLFVAGSAAAIGSLLEVVRAVPGLEGLEPKVSESLEQPFSRMLVRIKKEIIASPFINIQGFVIFVLDIFFKNSTNKIWIGESIETIFRRCFQ